VTTPAPQLSVLIASHNRRDLLRRCLDSLRVQTQDPSTFEVVVAADGATDGSAEMVDALETPYELRLLQREKAGKPAALDAAVDAARGEVCLFIDDDVIASPELVAEHLSAHRHEPMTLGIGGITQQPVDGRDWYAHAFARGWNEHYEEKPRSRIGWIDCYGANFSAPSSALREVGGFAELATAEDVEMGFRLERAGCVPTFLPQAHGVHDDQKSGRRMLADQRRQGSTHVDLARRCPEMAPQLLTWEETAVPHELALRRALIAIRFPPRLLAAIGWAIPGEGRKMLWFHLTRRFAFWRAVRESVDRREWSSIA
jgi:glycosyltransferase involved in cell wall biosynthesis